ncbi:hypothetical protein CKAH01_10754 [Colletotrichum kahawae]|uniref:Uncharacterized protein n=1 Tax=Colletotrichum kahawae TaxID=34407 RepID=A0AAE0CX66_COLKA|nr:hypothetical protein CKAH01_10754 [Colletotrichum kahawae]
MSNDCYTVLEVNEYRAVSYLVTWLVTPWDVMVLRSLTRH